MGAPTGIANQPDPFTQAAHQHRAAMITWARQAEVDCWARAQRAETMAERSAWVTSAAAAWVKRFEMENA